jgi:hypothetical protein
MKLDLNFQLTDVELLNLPKETEVTAEAIHAGKVVANLLVTSTESENPLKFFDWALDLHKGKVIDIDKQDVEILKKFIKQHQKMSVFAKAQVLNKFNALTE